MNHSFYPMSEAAYYILLSLLEERHGYGIMQHVTKITSSRIELGAGTLYGTLVKLEKSGLIATTREEEKRKYYLITNEGKKILETELNRIKELYENGRGALENGK